VPTARSHSTVHHLSHITDSIGPCQQLVQTATVQQAGCTHDRPPCVMAATAYTGWSTHVMYAAGAAQSTHEMPFRLCKLTHSNLPTAPTMLAAMVAACTAP
jgi:hypothetical protein